MSRGLPAGAGLEPNEVASFLPRPTVPEEVAEKLEVVLTRRRFVGGATVATPLFVLEIRR